MAKGTPLIAWTLAAWLCATATAPLTAEEETLFGRTVSAPAPQVRAFDLVDPLTDVTHPAESTLDQRASAPGAFVLHDGGTYLEYVNGDGDYVYAYKESNREIYHTLGLGIVDRSGDLLGFHQLFRTKDGTYVGMRGASVYLLDPEGRLLTTGGHIVVRQGDTWYTGYGAGVYTVQPHPITLAEKVETEARRERARLERLLDEQARISAKNGSASRRLGDLETEIAWARNDLDKARKKAEADVREDWVVDADGVLRAKTLAALRQEVAAGGWTTKAPARGEGKESEEEDD